MLALHFAASLLFFLLLIGIAAPPGFPQAFDRNQAHGKTHKKDEGKVRPELAASPEILTPEDEASQKELGQLARALASGTANAYEPLKSYAEKHAADNWGARAALALGYFDYTRNHNAQAAPWLEKAMKDELLKQYVLYWRAQVERVLGREAAALADLQTIRRDYPDCAAMEQVVEALAATALGLRKPQEAVAALEAYANTASKPELLFERAHARQQTGALARAAKDYQAVYYRFPLSDEAGSTGSILGQLSKRLGREYPRPTPEQQEARAQAFYDGHKWREARVEFEKLLTMVDKKTPGVTRQRALLRVAEARVQLDGSPSLLSSPSFGDPELDAERLYALSQAWRTNKREKEMFAALDQLASRYPQSRWNEDGIFSAGNYYWVNLDRDRAAAYYERSLETFPGGKYAIPAEWRIVWVAYLERKPEASQLLEAFLSKYPSSPYAVNALYWLGRTAERTDNPAHARSFYRKAEERFPETYFGLAAAARLAAIGREPLNPAEVVEKIPPAPLNRSVEEPVPPAAAARWARAEALRTIAFDASAELELRAAYFATASPRLIFEASQAALDQEHYSVGMSLGRLAFPSLEAHKIDEVPAAVWRTVFPLPYESFVRKVAERNGVDPMLIAGLIKQESIFQNDAISRAGAIGLMQVLPKTGRLMAKRLKLRYSREKLFDPEYNLQLGALYLSDLLKQFGSPEAALAAYNAGEDRIAAWQGERKFEELPELVESVPFTETREYIQIVVRNAEVYRMLYNGPGRAEAGKTQP
ncbi:MAG TPA: transglycosylase SLT domain-containing protein [Candidatus Acidoferrales bacterium]|nr:transglycosylase SLT domain-containing protein [Candidatus Acidoferrales bacterium]